MDIQVAIIKIGIAVLVGGIIGAEREYRSKNAGFRTMILVTLGATLFTMISGILTNGKDFHVVGNIVVGIGFLGAGAIYKDGNTISGLTTSVTIWISAALGMAIGCGEFEIALLSVLVVVIILVGFSTIQIYIDKKNREIIYTITIKNDNGSNRIVSQLIKTVKLKYFYSNTRCNKNKLTFVLVANGPTDQHQQFIVLLSSSKEIISFSA